MQDTPLRIELESGPWQPENHDHRFRGRVSLRHALEQSLNVPLVRLAQAVGLDRVIETARSLGIESPMHDAPSLALGAFEVNLLELTGAYVTLASGGRRAPRVVATAARRSNGDSFPIRSPSPIRVASVGEAHLVTVALRGAVDRGSAAGIRKRGFRGAVAAKTGSSDGYRDAWALAYTPDLAVGVWLGFDDGRSLGGPAEVFAIPLLADVLVAALGRRGKGSFEAPPDVVRIRTGETDAEAL